LPTSFGSRQKLPGAAGGKSLFRHSKVSFSAIPDSGTAFAMM